MAGFNLPIIDPNSLPAMRHQPPGLIPGPVKPPPLGPSPGFRPPAAMTMAPMAMPQAAPGFNLQNGLGMIGAGLDLLRSRNSDPGVQAQRAANAADASVQANPSTSIAGMAAGTNPDFGLVPGSMMPPPDGGTGVGAPTRIDFLTGFLRSLRDLFTPAGSQ
jgi:hypothetical protein